MPECYWFASVLIDPEGRWRGRFVRPWPPVSTVCPAVRGTAGDGEAAGELLFVPFAADAMPAAGTMTWAAPGTDAPADCLLCEPDPPPSTAVRFRAARAGNSLPVVRSSTDIVLDTGLVAGWDWPAGPTTTLADVGHLQHRPPPSRPDPARSKARLVDLLALVTCDAEGRELESALKPDVELSYQLLRLVNSAAMGLTRPIRSIGHAITLIGRRQLKRWLQLLLYANIDSGNRPNPLLQLAAYRGRLAEVLTPHRADTDAAWMTGIFSLLDRVIPESMAGIVARLPVADDVRDALVARAGVLGRLLGACEAAEAGRLDAATHGLGELGIAPDDWWNGQQCAFRWAFAIGRNLATEP